MCRGVIVANSMMARSFFSWCFRNLWARWRQAGLWHLAKMSVFVTSTTDFLSFFLLVIRNISSYSKWMQSKNAAKTHTDTIRDDTPKKCPLKKTDLPTHLQFTDNATVNFTPLHSSIELNEAALPGQTARFAQSLSFRLLFRVALQRQVELWRRPRWQCNRKSEGGADPYPSCRITAITKWTVYTSF